MQEIVDKIFNDEILGIVDICSYHEEGPPRFLWISKGWGIIQAGKSEIMGSEFTGVEIKDCGLLKGYWKRTV
jgi:hypothetical protein